MSGCNPDDEHFFVIGTVKDAYPAPARQTTRRAPKKVVIQFLRARMFEAVNFAALRIDARHDVLDRAVFSGGVHRLENEKNRITIRGVEEILLRAQLVDLPREQLAVVRFRFVERRGLRRALA